MRSRAGILYAKFDKRWTHGEYPGGANGGDQHAHTDAVTGHGHGHVKIGGDRR